MTRLKKIRRIATRRPRKKVETRLPGPEGAIARAAYQDFLALWKDADPDVPILKEAKAEYAKLQ